MRINHGVGVGLGLYVPDWLIFDNFSVFVEQLQRNVFVDFICRYVVALCYDVLCVMSTTV